MATGFALNIDEKLLKNLASADEHIQNIGTHSEQTRDKFNAAFQQMATGSLNDFISKLAEAKRAISDVGSANVQFNGVVNISNQAVKASDDIVNLVSTLAKLKHIMSQMGGENFSAAGLFNMGGQTKEITKELRADLRKTQTWMTKLKEATDAYENSIGNLSANIARAKEAQRSFNEELKRASKQQAGGLINQQGQARTLNELKAYAKELQKTMANLDPKSSEWEKLNKIYKQTNREIKSINSSMKDMNNTHKSLINTADQLKRAFALMFSVSAIRGYVTEIARVRGEFELQQRSLQAILQNKDEADRLWQQTIQLAVRSPFQVKELVTYTKQLAAYRVESDKLYDTTKMLADVSAGLGVDMNRLILAYGQVKAANYLRGTELRQFSEAGVNILAELAKYFTELEGRAVSVGDVFERVSKRMVTFADVEEIFKRITSEGGVFYNMQEIQAETLKGQISNLRDSVDIMLNDIGKANEHILKGSVNAVKLFVENWQMLVPVLKAIVAGFALTRVNALLAKESIMLMAMDFGVLVNAEQKALTVTQLLNVGWKSFVKNIKAAGAAAKAFVASNPILAALTAILYVLVKVGSAWMEHKREIDEINKKYQDLGVTIKSISNKFSFAQAENNTDTLRRELNQLIELANREYNMGIKVDVSGLNAEQLANKFIEIRDKIFNAQEVAKTFELAMQKTASWKPDSIDIYGDLEETEEKVLEQYSVFRKVATHTVFEMNKIQDKLTQTQLDALKKLQEPQQVNETQFQYVERLRRAYISLMSTYLKYRNSAEISDTNRAQLLQQEANILSKMGIPASTLADMFQSWGVSLSNTQEEFDKVFNELDKEIPQFLNGEGKEYYIKTAIDKKGFTDIQRELAYFFANQRYGINITPTIPISNKNDEVTPTVDDKQNKLTSKRISLIKEMRREYEQLNKTFDKTASKEKVIESYTNAVNEAFKGTGISIADIKFESLENLAESLEGLKDLAAKEGTEAKLALEKAISGIRVQIGVETKQGADKELKQQVEDLFSRYDITLDLEKLGISKDLMSGLFNVESLDLSGLRQQVESMRDKFIGTDMEKEYQQYIDKITDMEKKAVVERTKTYVKYLMEAQREAVKIKVEELRKLKEIEESKEFSPEQKQEIKDRVRKETNADLQKQEWADFQNTEMYTMMFEDLEHYGTQALETLRVKLEELKGSLTDLPASEVKEIINQLSKIEDITIERNPFRALKETRQQIKEEGTSKEQAQTNLVDSEREIAKLQAELDIINIVNTAKSKGLAIDKETLHAYDDIVVEAEGMGVAEADIVKAKEKSLKTEKENAQAAKTTLENYERQGKARVAALNKTKNILGSVQDATKASMELMDSLGVSTDSVAYSLAEGVDGMISLTLSAIEFGIQMEILGYQSNMALGIIGWIAIAIQAVVSIMSALFKMHDKGLQNQIDKLAEQTEVLKEKFDALSEAVDNAYNTDQLRTAAAEGKQYTEQMISNYEKMKQLEEDKKKTDKDAVKEYEDNIKEQREALRELEQQIVSEATAGILDNAADTARGFVDAWYDSFKEVGNGLKGLEDNFDEMFLNLAKQQATMQIAGNFAKQWEKDLSKYINETDTELTKAEAQKWAEEVKATFPALNDALEGFLGVITEGVGATGELSGLQAGIQGITESQAEILTAYANSCRFFLSSINTTLSDFATKVFDTEGDSNPILSQLRIVAQQTTAINSLLSSLTKGGHTEGGLGLKVFIN